MPVSSICWREMPGTSLLAKISMGQLHAFARLASFRSPQSVQVSRRNYFAHTHTHYYTLQTLHTVRTETFMVLNFAVFEDQWASVKSIICTNQHCLLSRGVKMVRLHRLHNIIQSTFAPLTSFFIVNAQQHHSKIHLCCLCHSRQFPFVLLLLCQPYTTSTRNLDETYLWMVSLLIPLPCSTFGSTTQAVCDELSKDRNNKLTVVMLLMLADIQ